MPKSKKPKNESSEPENMGAERTFTIRFHEGYPDRADITKFTIETTNDGEVQRTVTYDENQDKVIFDLWQELYEAFLDSLIELDMIRLQRELSERARRSHEN